MAPISLSLVPGDTLVELTALEFVARVIIITAF
jgi:hypothetical protein